MNNLKISIIIPVYNAEKYIYKCLNSVIAQTYNEIQVIIIDDGSTDNSGEICDLYASKYSNFNVIHKLNSGVSASRNEGLKHVVGRYFTFLDSDDWYDKTYIENCVKGLEHFKYPDLIFTSYIREYKNSAIINKIFGLDKSAYFNEKRYRNEIYRRLYGPIDKETYNPSTINDFSPVWGKFYKTSICKNIKFCPLNEVGSEDLWFNVCTQRKLKTALYIGGVFYHYNKANVVSLTHNLKPFLIFAWKRLFDLMQNIIVSDDLDDRFKMALNNRVAIQLFDLLREIANSEEKFSFKKKSMSNLLGDRFFYKRLNTFNLQFLRNDWKLFFKLMEGNRINALFFIIKIGEPIKKYLK